MQNAWSEEVKGAIDGAAIEIGIKGKGQGRGTEKCAIYNL